MTGFNYKEANKEVTVAEGGLLAVGKVVRDGDGVLELTEKGYVEAIRIWNSYSHEIKLLMLLLYKLLDGDSEVIPWEK